MQETIKKIVFSLAGIYLVFVALPNNTILTTLTGLRLAATEQYLGIAMPDTLPYPVDISKWRIVAYDNSSFEIGNGVYLLEQGKVNTSTPIVLRAGERALLLPGPSPVGVSFKLNECSGYLEQFQNFTPLIPKECPKASTMGSDTACDAYIDTVPQCEIPTNGLAINALTLPCQTFVKENINYPSCVKANQNSAAFEKNEWRIYPAPMESTWYPEEFYKLYDGNGNFIGIFKALNPSQPE
jgi:hypothetical protein